MKTIVFAARKGGSSKTTLTAHVGVEAERVGDGPVIFIDIDPQRSLTDWWEARGADTPSLVECPIEKLHWQIDSVKERKGIILIDTPPLIAETIESVIKVSDFVVIPVKPTPTDLRAIGVTVSLAKQHNKPFAFVITQAISRSTLTIKAPSILSNHGKVATMIMHYRSDYASCMGSGLTAKEIDPKGKASEEIEDLWQYLKTQIS